MVLPEKKYEIPKALTKKELCQFLGVYPQFIETQVAEGKLRQRQLSHKKIVYLPSDLQEWFDNSLTPVLNAKGEGSQNAEGSK